ncbi:MAG TPA: STAS domain-containing protein [bacterium]|jgi:anti-anti-sigma factor
MTQLNDYEYISGIHVFRLRGDFTPQSLDQLKTTVTAEVASRGTCKVLFNLEFVDYITSKDLGVFVQIFRYLAAESKNNSTDAFLALCHVGTFAMDVIEMTKLENIFRIFETEEHAIRELAGDSSGS